MGAFSSCSCLTALPGPAWVLLSKTYKPFSSPLYSYVVCLQPVAVSGLVEKEGRKSPHKSGETRMQLEMRVYSCCTESSFLIRKFNSCASLNPHPSRSFLNPFLLPLVPRQTRSCHEIYSVMRDIKKQMAKSKRAGNRDCDRAAACRRRPEPCAVQRSHTRLKLRTLLERPRH